MERHERLAVAALVLILVGLPVIILGYQYGLRPALAQVRTIDIVAAVPETGGFQPDSIEVKKGERVRLRFSVPDVTHGVAIAGLGVDLGHIDPGQVKEAEVVFDEPGIVTFYCNTWCSPNHWRMRGTITVIDPEDPDAHNRANRRPDPVIEALIERGVNIDAARQAEVIPASQPSPAAGKALADRYGPELPADFFDVEWVRRHSPAEAFFVLRQVLPQLNQEQAWDIIAHVWTAGLSAEDRAWAETAYAKNCAACHGQQGLGDGPAAAAINEQLEAGDMADMVHGVIAFTPSPQAIASSKDIYYAKLRRGGMGTSMPAFGPIFDEAESWLLVEYLWWLTFNNPVHPEGHGEVAP